jgi:glycosyltransferase involved in cell wall biosynthesis
MQTVLLNALNIRAGGGVQKVSSFLSSLSKERGFRDKYLVISQQRGPIRDLCDSHGFHQCLIRGGNAGRAWFELSCRRRFSRECLCFNLGGLTLLHGADYFVNLSECAFSNLFYPEIDFWSDYGRAGRVKRQLVDSYRRYAVARSDYWIFQTEAIRKRAIELCGFPERRTCVVSPSPSAMVSDQSLDTATMERMNRAIPGGFRFLFLNGAQPNKRIHLLPRIAAEMLKRRCTDFCFLSTMPHEHLYTLSIVQKFKEMGLASHFQNIGTVPHRDVPSIVHTVQAVCTFSRLESYSNNFVEAWKMERPLVVTDADWARDSCKSAALYVDPANFAQTAERLADLIATPRLQASLVEEGKKRLQKLPSPEQKTRLYLQHIEEASELGPWPKEQRRAIRWPKVHAI